MRVKELIERLQYVDPDKLVVMSSDVEGNNYSPLANLEEAYYFSYNSWSGEVWSKEDAEAEADDGDLEQVLIFYPVN